MYAIQAVMEMPYYKTTHLAAYRTYSYDWYFELLEKMGKEAFEELRDKIYRSIELLLPGKRYNILMMAENMQEPFVRFACYWIMEHGGIDECKIEFSSDWKYLINRKHPTDE